MAATNTYVGFSSIGILGSTNLTLYDIELVKRDLLNHFMTRIGERVGRVDFGCLIWDYLYDQGVANLDQLIIDEAQRICKSDPRVNLLNTSVTYFSNGIRIDMTLFYVGLQITNNFQVIFEVDERLAYGQPV